MTVSTLIKPAAAFLANSITRNVADTRAPQNHWAWTGWMPED